MEQTGDPAKRRRAPSRRKAPGRRDRNDRTSITRHDNRRRSQTCKRPPLAASVQARRRSFRRRSGPLRSDLGCGNPKEKAERDSDPYQDCSSALATPPDPHRPAKCDEEDVGNACDERERDSPSDDGDCDSQRQRRITARFTTRDAARDATTAGDNAANRNAGRASSGRRTRRTLRT